MIEFLQDYVTKSVPPEAFKAGQQVADRSPESELYFVRLGIAGFVTEGGLVDDEYRLIVRAALTGEVATIGLRDRPGIPVGLDAPRARSGPVVDGVDIMASDLGAEVARLTAELEAAAVAFREQAERCGVTETSLRQQAGAATDRATALEAKLVEAGQRAEAAVADAAAAKDRIAAAEAAATTEKTRADDAEAALAEVREELAALKAKPKRTAQ